MAQSSMEILADAEPLRAERLTPAHKVADQFGVTRRTLSRWIVDPELDFPQPFAINKRLYFRQREVDAWKALCRRAASMETEAA